MLSKRAATLSYRQCRTINTARRFQPVQGLQDATVETFRKHAFEPAIPALLPRGTFKDLPAAKDWFIRTHDGHIGLKIDHLGEYGDTIVPLELSDGKTFTRIEQPLAVFLQATEDKTSQDIYLAQCSLPNLPPSLQSSLPTPELVQQAGKGDIYDSSLWLGRAPTYTPLHRDPNPNLFVQLAGKKVVRLFRPRDGDGIFARVQERIGGSGSATMRGEEMMVGEERRLLEEVVWGEGQGCSGFEAELESGDGLFIPKGWWHSIKGVGEGMTGSVNWWFR